MAMDAPTPQQLARIARLIDADKMFIIATTHLGIDSTKYSHIEDGAGFARDAWFKRHYYCLEHWVKKNQGGKLVDILKEAYMEDNISIKAVKVMDPDFSGEIKILYGFQLTNFENFTTPSTTYFIGL